MSPAETIEALRHIQKQVDSLLARLETERPCSFLLPEIAKLPAPVGASHTSAIAWRRHLQTLRLELKEHFGEKEFRLKDLCSFLDSRVELLPGDIKTYISKNRQVFVWHQTVHGAISCRAHVWGARGVAISYTGIRDRWRVV